MFFQWFVAPEARIVGSLKRRVRSQLARWEMNNCTPSWPEAHFQVKKYNTHQVRSTFWSWDVEKVHAVVAWSTLQKSKCTKYTMLGPLLEVEMMKKCMPLWREARFEVKSAKNWGWGVRNTFGRSDVVSRGRRKGLCTLSKVRKTCVFCSISKNDGRRGTFEEDLQKCILRGRRSTKDMFIRDVRRSGRWFPEKGCILEHQICRFAKMILRDRCSTSYDLASIFRGRRSTLGRWTGKSAKRISTRLSALHSTFHFWRKSRRIHAFLMLTWKLRKSRRIASFLTLSNSKLKMSRRIAAFLMLSSSKTEEVSQYCFVFDVVTLSGSKIEESRRIAAFSSLQVDRQTHRQTNR